MKKTIQVIIILLFPLLAFAQTNILDQLGEHMIGERYWIEKGDYYYFITEQSAGPKNSFFNQAATQFVLNKYNKYTFQRISSSVVAGDTLQNDSIVTYQPTVILKNDVFYLQYVKFSYDNGVREAYCHKRVDINFNVKVPETRYDQGYYFYLTFLDCSYPLENGNYFVGYQTVDSVDGSTANYLILDTLGNVIKHGEPGTDPFATGANSKGFRSFFPLDDHRYVQAGTSMGGYYYGDPNDFGWCVVDEEMNVIDTFRYKRGLDSAIELDQAPKTIALPSGSFICYGNRPDPSNWDITYTYISKHTAATRYGVDKLIYFSAIDNTDSSHGMLNSTRSMGYNPTDHLLYFGSVTHKDRWSSGLGCSYNSDKSFLEIICTDTNLVVKWRKYIKLAGVCSILGTLSVPDGRGGILLAGRSIPDFSSDTNDYWVYYVDDNTPSADPLTISTLEANNKNISIYPNPTSGILQIVSETNLLREVRLYDISGRLLLTKTIDRERSEIDLSSLKKGIYLLKCLDKNGIVYMKKIMKE